MTNRIDHAAEARELLENYAPDYTVALVHATLALVEQQRIANRIAIGVAIRDDLILRNSEDDLNDSLTFAFVAER